MASKVAVNFNQLIIDLMPFQFELTGSTHSVLY